MQTIQKALQEKLREFEGLVGGLSDVGRSKKKERRRSEAVRSPRQSPNQKIWRNERGIGDVLDLPQGVRQAEGWLPTIAEGKSYPRRTLEYVSGAITGETMYEADEDGRSQEISNIANSGSSDSPELGPPPRTFIDRQEGADGASAAHGDENDNVQLPDFLSANFDTRRRRRETHVRRDSSLVSALESSPNKDGERPSDLLSSQPVRSGLKRKLDSSDRPNDMLHSPDKAPEMKQNRQERSAGEAARETQSSPVRRVLAPKAVNTDPVVSPRKATTKEKDDVKPKTIGKAEAPANRERTKSKESVRREREVEIPQQCAPEVAVTELPLEAIKTEPKTPGPLDLFSPVSTQPSEARQEGRSGTPPPADLTTRTAPDPAAGGARGSRRARTAVSYAEPSLVSKMRRPGKDLADAVVKNDRRSTSAQMEVKKEHAEPSMDAKMRTVVLSRGDRHQEGKTESAAGQRPEPQSPLGSRKESKTADDAGGVEPRSALSSTMSKLMDSGRSARDRDGATRADTKGTESAMLRMDIYDIHDSPEGGSVDKKQRQPEPRPRSQQSARPTAANSSRATSSSTSNPPLSRSVSTTSLNRPRSTSRRQTLGGGASDGKDAPAVATSSTQSRLSGTTAASRPSSRTDETPPSREEKSATALGRRRSMLL